MISPRRLERRANALPEGDAFQVLSRAAGAEESLVANAVGVTGAVTGAVMLVCALAGIDHPRSALPLLAVAVVLTAGGVTVARSRVAPARLRGPEVFAAVVASWATMIAASAVAYLASGTLSRVDDAVFESVSGYSTTGLTLVVPEELARGVLLWRAATQWLGALSAMVLAIALLPFFGGGRELADHETARGVHRTLAPRVVDGVRHVVSLYSAFTGVLAVAYLVAGLGVVDAVATSLTTVSTGGFATHSDSIAHFGGAGAQWLTVVAMLLAGANLAVLWWAIRGDARALWRSFELRVYLLMFASATAAVTAWSWDDTGGGEGAVRGAAFSVAAAMSTTGHRIVEWGQWTDAAQVLLLLLMGVGSMAGSAGGGFRIMRVIEAAGFMRRELVRQLHPRAVVTVKIGRTTVSERSLERMNAYQLLFILVAFIGAVAVALTGEDVFTSISAAVSAISTVGPSPGEVGAFGDATAFDATGRMILATLMLLGRLSIYPVLLTLGAVVGGVLRAGRELPRRVR
ncbi:MAG: TrkH family potassium uptake protein [Acidimicrobiales bacterium]|nr:TrkH family potassium uptake protein [Acidimicrobiales bacterium]